MAPADSRCTEANSTIAGLLPTDVVKELVGSVGLPHGAEVISHGLSPSRFLSDGDSDFDGRTSLRRVPQQQASPSHRTPHLHWCSFAELS